MLDDWFALANARFDGWWMAAGADQWRARPGAGAVYAVVFGVIGRRPTVAFALQLVLVVAVAFSLQRLLCTFVPEGVAWTVAAVWIVVPNHGSLLFWTSAVNITIALLLLIGGLRWLTHERHLLGALALAASVLTYEATAGAALLGAVALPLLQGRPWRRPLVICGATIGAAVAWTIVFLHPAKRGLDVRADLAQLLPAHAGWGVFPDGAAAVAGGLLFVVGLTLLAVGAVRQRALHTDEALALAGLVVVLVGTLPFVAYFYSPLGAGDRVNVVAAVGTAMAWSGLGWWAWTRARMAAQLAAAGVLSAMLVSAFASATAWADAVDDGERILARISPGSALPGSTVSIPTPPMRRNVAAFLDRSNIRGAVQVEVGTREVDAELTPAR